MSEHMSITQLTSAADRQYAYGLGADRPHVAYILSDRDVWYANPSYIGPRQPHPDEWEGMSDEQAAELSEQTLRLRDQITATHRLENTDRPALGTVEFAVLGDGARVLVNDTLYEVAQARRLYRALVGQGWQAF